MRNGGIFAVMTTVLLLLFGALTAAVLETPAGRVLIVVTGIALVLRLVAWMPRRRSHALYMAAPLGTKLESVRFRL